jgi:hypothetical protein
MVKNKRQLKAEEILCRGKLLQVWDRKEERALRD